MDIVRWKKHPFSGFIYVVSEIEGRGILLDLYKMIRCDSLSREHTPDSMREVLRIYERIEQYMVRHGEESEPVIPGRRAFTFKDGFPVLSTF